jgi:hypothetical protein
VASLDRDVTLICAAAFVTEEQSVSMFVGYVYRDNACMDQTINSTLALVPAKFCECGFPHSIALGGPQMILGHYPIP